MDSDHPHHIADGCALVRDQNRLLRGRSIAFWRQVRSLQSVLKAQCYPGVGRHTADSSFPDKIELLFQPDRRFLWEDSSSELAAGLSLGPLGKRLGENHLTNWLCR